jgi:hypothetical protein
MLVNINKDQIVLGLLGKPATQPHQQTRRRAPEPFRQGTVR